MNNRVSEWSNKVRWQKRYDQRMSKVVGKYRDVQGREGRRREREASRSIGTDLLGIASRGICVFYTDCDGEASMGEI